MKLKYTILFDRVLIKVPKMKEKFEGSSLYMPEDLTEKETISQTIGVIEQIGHQAFTNPYDRTIEKHPLKVGDKVHFIRYGAIRLNPKKHEDCEYWVVRDKDILCIEEETKK